MKLSSTTEEKLKQEVISLLEKGKPNWDIPHTIDSAKWMKRLVEKEGGNEKILVSAMYLHDIGYPELEAGYSFKQYMGIKMKHAEKGAAFGDKILRKIGDYSEDEIKEITFFVLNHDKHDNLETHNRQLVFEADGLAQINWLEVKPSFNKADCQRFLDEYFEKERPEERWKTETGKRYRKELLKKAQQYLMD
jgi:HD superfamily phosphodiesterase